ncbi:MAG: alpha/beta fold hydrolase, partial [Marinomonas sp.]
PARLALIETAIAQIEEAPAPDLRMYFDLNDLRLDILIEQERFAEAANLAAALSGFALQNAAVIHHEPISYAQRAASLFEQAGDIRAALVQLETEANLRLDSGQTGKALAQVYRSMARLAEDRGDTAGAARFAALAKNAEEPSNASVRSSGEAGYSEVDVFYATDRARSGDRDPNSFYGHGRGALEYGVVKVSIPASHTAGAIEMPSIWRLEFGPKPAKHVMLRKVTPKDSASFFAEMQDKVSESPRKEAFVFVHGFNTRFDAAARRAAQLAYDMNYSGVPILYSWPSAGKTFSYVADTAVVRLSGRRLAKFLEELQANSGAETIHIVAHSMGNRALTDALELLALKTDAAEGKSPMFGQIFFAAPDVDAGLFREMMHTIRPIGQRMTLYASDVDWALAASRKLHGHAPRAGQGGEDILTGPEF